MPQLGSTVKDRLSGFTGVQIAVTYHLWKEPKALVQPHGLRGNQPIDPIWFSERTLIEVRPAPREGD